MAFCNDPPHLQQVFLATGYRIDFTPVGKEVPLSCEPLESAEGAKEAFEKLSPSHRNEFLAYLNSLKTPASLERNAKEVVDYLMSSGKGSSQ